jgi:hypothetical protein
MPLFPTLLLFLGPAVGNVAVDQCLDSQQHAREFIDDQVKRGYSETTTTGESTVVGLVRDSVLSSSTLLGIATSDRYGTHLLLLHL